MSQLLLHVMLVVDADPEPTTTKQQHYWGSGVTPVSQCDTRVAVLDTGVTARCDTAVIARCVTDVTARYDTAVIARCDTDVTAQSPVNVVRSSLLDGLAPFHALELTCHSLRYPPGRASTKHDRRGALTTVAERPKQ